MIFKVLPDYKESVESYFAFVGFEGTGLCRLSCRPTAGSDRLTACRDSSSLGEEHQKWVRPSDYQWRGLVKDGNVVGRKALDKAGK